MPPIDFAGIPRREFVKAAVAIGGANALAACLDRERSVEAEPEFPRGPSDLSELPTRQHAWGQYIVHDIHGNTVLPEHQLLLFLDYTGSIPPTDGERDTVERALRTLERALQRGTGGDMGAAINRGLIHTLGYSTSYFDQFDADFPEDIDLRPPESVLSAVGEDPAKADHYDALLLLTSDFGSILLAAEEALFGNLAELNGIEVEARLKEIFEKVERRTGVVGKGLPAEKLDEERIPEHAPLSMGFKSGFRDNLPSEDRVTISGGPFDQGTTQQVSRLMIDLDGWYEKDDRSRVKEMFSPEHTVEEVGRTGEPLGSDSGITEDIVDSIDDHAERYGRLGHSQKTATARDDDFEPRILRRSEGVATDVAADGKAGFNFTSVQRRIEDFIATRRAMNVGEYDVEVDDHHHGIVDFFDVRSRATFLLPPRTLRALPSPRPNG